MDDVPFTPCLQCASPDAPGLCGPCGKNRDAIRLLNGRLRTALRVREGLPEDNRMETVGDEPAWRDAAGTVTPVRELTDEHLKNVIIYLRRRHEAAVLDSAGLVNGDGDGDMGIAWEEFDLAGPELSCNAVYPRLLEEALRRNLRIQPLYESSPSEDGP